MRVQSHNRQQILNKTLEKKEEKINKDLMIFNENDLNINEDGLHLYIIS